MKTAACAAGAGPAVVVVVEVVDVVVVGVRRGVGDVVAPAHETSSAASRRR